MAKRALVLVGMLLSASALVQATEPCRTIRGRAHLYGGDGQLRIWHIGTHHEFQPDAASWDRVVGWLTQGEPPPEQVAPYIPGTRNYLFGEFVICPVESYRAGSVQTARIESVAHRRYVPVP